MVVRDRKEAWILKIIGEHMDRKAFLTIARRLA